MPINRNDITSPKRILLVEDDPSFAEVLATFLEGEGFKVFSAQGRVSALDLAAAHPIDLLLCDLRFADGNGIDLLREIRSQSDVRAIALSGSMLDDMRDELEAVGFKRILTKPVGLDEVLNAICQVLS